MPYLLGLASGYGPIGENRKESSDGKDRLFHADVAGRLYRGTVGRQRLADVRGRLHRHFNDEMRRTPIALTKKTRRIAPAGF
ncbi:hypothetical protein [Mesorhizobium sp. M0217]|uniref:hypothetical protein n=1 Tax=unclassified Mesorhizobium TaxID=325217 RepID=UPI003337FBF4